MSIPANSKICRQQCQFEYCVAHGCYYQSCGFITEPPATRECRACDKPGAYVRTRHFENSKSDVFECNTPGCENRNLIWHVEVKEAVAAQT